MSEAAYLVRPRATRRAPQRAARRGRLHGDAVTALRRMILTGELAPGERLREVVLCTQLGISRTPVREAFRTLAAEGLITLLPNRSVVVAELDDSEIADLYEVFGALEGLAGEIACAKITEKEIAEIAALQHEMVVLYQKRERANYLKVNHLIHRRIVEAAGNPVLKSTWEILLPRVERARALANLRPERWVEALHEHSVMFTALARRDGPLLSRLLREHFANGLAAIGQALKDAQPSAEKR
ncbi:MAG: GntR family transcriptional regulator [Propylenella sp.]